MGGGDSMLAYVGASGLVFFILLFFGVLARPVDRVEWAVTVVMGVFFIWAICLFVVVFSS